MTSTNEIILLEEPYARVSLNSQKVLTIRVKKGVSPEDFMFAHEHALLFAKRERVHQIIIDESDLERIGYKARAWLLFKQIPKVFMEFGFNMQIAVVRPSNRLTGIGNKALSVATDKLRSRFKLEFFEEEGQAKNWIASNKLPAQELKPPTEPEG